MILAAHQPAYLPWLGYFEKIARADVFVFLDTVQYEKNSFINRNKIKTPQGPQWLTIPVRIKGHISSSLLETQIDERQPWRIKHLRSIEMNYRKAPNFNENFPKLKNVIFREDTSLAEMCWYQLQFWLMELGINTKVVRASDLQICSKKSDLVLDLCRDLGADTYISGAMGKNYLNETDFAVSGIQVEYQDFKHPVYPQLWGGFESSLSIVDYWMNCSSNLTECFGEMHGV